VEQLSSRGGSEVNRWNIVAWILILVGIAVGVAIAFSLAFTAWRMRRVRS
jgi:hypothetical protein